MQPEIVAGWMRRRVTEANAQGLVVGLSGGIDSAVVARLCQMAMPNAALGVVLPCHSHPDDARDASLVAEQFRLPTVTIALDEPYDALVRVAEAGATAAAEVLGVKSAASDEACVRMSSANLKPRLRMAALYFVANRFNYLVAGTGNRCELAIGYFTKYGDGGVDLLPLGTMLKSQVREMARELGVPQPIIDKPPTAGLWLGQTDEGEMGFTYPQLEAYLEKGPDAVSPAVAVRVERLMRTSEHKRRMAPVPPSGAGDELPDGGDNPRG